MMMNIIKKLSIITLLSSGMVMAAVADVAVITHPDNPVKLDDTQLRNIFLGKIKVFDNGMPVFPIDIEPGDASRDIFVSKILHKNEANLNAYWARMLFSSKGRPPEEVEDSAAVMKTVAANKSAIGYVDASVVDSSVRVLKVIK
jgi:ABC-type phosphate transport system substrate-binding protein